MTKLRMFRDAFVLACLLSLSQAPALGAADGESAVLVTVTEVVSDALAPRVPAAGTVFSRNETQITAGMAGRLAWVAEPGDRVAAGTPVARFDCDLLDLQRERQLAEAERARISYENLSREVERLESLREASVIAEIERERTQANRDLANSDLRIAKIAVRETDALLGRCTVAAPFTGVVTSKLRNAGEDVERSTVLAAMTDTEHLEVRAAVPIRYLPRMRSGDAAEIRLNDLQLDGRIRTIVPAANSQSQTFEVRVDLPDHAPQLVAAGQLVSVSLPLTATTALTVPRDSVVLHADGTFVMRINEQAKAERIAVEVTEATGDRVAVRGSLSPGDRIAVRGAEALSDGELVAVQSDI